VEIISGTFLGNSSRNYYGEDPPSELNIKWKLFLGKGRTNFSADEWAGAGWTGQPLVTKESGEVYLYQGAFDHRLKKINAATGKVVWQYRFDDIIKGTGTIYRSPRGYTLIQGSRRGYGIPMGAKECFSLRSIDISNGNENWRYNVKPTISFSRDADASPLVINDTVIAPLENGMLSFINPGVTSRYKSYSIPEEIEEVALYDKKAWRKNIVIESSPCVLGNIIYAAGGSGYVYGVNASSKAIEFEFYIGSDLDGSVSVSDDSCLFVPVEKQYIAGKGGVFKLDPRKKGSPVVWYYPAEDKEYADWFGGVIGSAATSGSLCAFTGIDGYLYVLKHDSIETGVHVNGPDNSTKYPLPVLLEKRYIGPSVSTPLIIGNTLIACSYTGIYLYRIESNSKLTLLDKFSNGFEATPVCYDKSIYVASRDGYLYCFGEK
jgi:outer membrane protein assembly factor BamB